MTNDRKRSITTKDIIKKLGIVLPFGMSEDGYYKDNKNRKGRKNDRDFFSDTNPFSHFFNEFGAIIIFTVIFNVALVIYVREHLSGMGCGSNNKSTFIVDNQKNDRTKGENNTKDNQPNSNIGINSGNDCKSANYNPVKTNDCPPESLLNLKSKSKIVPDLRK